VRGSKVQTENCIRGRKSGNREFNEGKSQKTFWLAAETAAVKEREEEPEGDKDKSDQTSNTRRGQTSKKKPGATKEKPKRGDNEKNIPVRARAE